MPKQRVERGTDYKLRCMIRGEIAAQNVPISKACEYAGCCQQTLYRVFDKPTAYMDKALRLLRNLSVPIESVREAISYPW